MVLLPNTHRLKRIYLYMREILARFHRRDNAPDRRRSNHRHFLTSLGKASGEAIRDKGVLKAGEFLQGRGRLARSPNVQGSRVHHG